MQFNWQKLKDENFKDNFQKRARIIRLIREFFYQQGFLEVETPQLVKLPGMEPNLTPFKTELVGFKGGKQPAYLITSPEYAMKKLLCGGLERIWQITSSFRNAEDNSPMHNPEFKIMEWYRANSNYLEIAKDTENLVYYVNKKFNKSRYLIRDGKKIDLKTPWTRLTVKDAFKKYLNLDLVKFIKETPDWQTEFYKLFLTHIEPKLGWDKPVILMDYPAEMASLSKIKKDDPAFAERFEVYIAGLELANAFSELTNAEEQASRLNAEHQERLKDGKEDYPVDETFIDALKYGMPESGGIALGVDRLVMLLIGAKTLPDVILFPAIDIF